MEKVTHMQITHMNLTSVKNGASLYIIADIPCTLYRDRQGTSTYWGFELKFLPMKTCFNVSLAAMAAATSGMPLSKPQHEILSWRRHLVRERTFGRCWGSRETPSSLFETSRLTPVTLGLTDRPSRRDLVGGDSVIVQYYYVVAMETVWEKDGRRMRKDGAGA